MTEFEIEIRKKVGAISCADFKGSESIKEIIMLWHTPKGVELCKKSDFPSSDMFERYWRDFLTHNVFVNCDCVALTNKDCVMYNSVGTLKFEYPEKVYDVILYGDNVVTIRAEKYSIVNIHNLNNSVVIIEKDDTSIVNVD